MVEEAGGRRAATELLFFDRGPLVVRACIVVFAAAGCGLAGYVLFRLHVQQAARLANGIPLNPVESLLATGSSARTAWPGWVAAGFFLVAVLRLRHGPPEPSPGVVNVEKLSAGQLRARLRIEYRVVRIALIVLSIGAAVDIARAIAHILDALRGDSAVVSTLAPTVLEAAGYALAATVLAVWSWIFGADVRRLGAL